MPVAHSIVSINFRKPGRLAILFLTLTGLLCACAPDTKSQLPVKASHEEEMKVQDAIREMFPGAVTYERYTDSLLFFLYAVHKIKPETILLGQSTCVDDVLNTKSPFSEHMVKGPFNFGGLGGLPFAGLTGLSAYAHHVPDSGAALLVVGPHIGYSDESGWGMILREGQDKTTTCCGALMAALSKLETGKITRESPHEPDYQQMTIEQFALLHKDEILSSKVPLVTFTKLINKEIARIMQDLPRNQVNYRHVIMVTGVIINTGHGFQDYIWVDNLSIYNLRTEQFLRVME